MPCQKPTMSNDPLPMSHFRGQKAGVDVNGQPVRLGEFDSMGHIVGYIDEDGNCWESIIERDRVKSASRFHDAMCSYKRGECEKPDPLKVAEEVCLDESNIEAALEEIEDDAKFVRAFRAMNKARSIETVLEDFSTDDLRKFMVLLELLRGEDDE